jgi:anaerobic ribonucleoside-triphosphate reductase activating protein
MKRCVNCCNPDMLPIVARNVIDCDALWLQVVEARHQHDIEGVTFLGGEPFLQAKGLSYIGERCQSANLSVMVFTGYTWGELQKLALPYTEELVRCTDVLVDGPYLPELQEDRRNWVGSKNQRFFYFTDRYGHGIEYDPRYRRSTEIRVGYDGSIRVNGWPTEFQL